MLRDKLSKLDKHFKPSAQKKNEVKDGDEEVGEVTVTGAVLGDFCVASFSLDVADLAITAAVTAADTVTYQLLNNTGAAVDLASGTVRVRVLPQSA